MAEPVTLLSLPLFPLGTVLYPGGNLPLRIFEVRYLDMIGKCHKAGAPFGVVSLTAGSEVLRPNRDQGQGDGYAAESFNAIGTLATIVDFAAPQPGLMMLRCSGAQRFRIERSERLKHGLWIADVVRLPDDARLPVPADLQKAADALGRVIRSLQERGAQPKQMPLLAPYRLDDCGWVANRWCELLPLASELKQRLLELDSPLVRLELVADILQRMGLAD